MVLNLTLVTVCPEPMGEVVTCDESSTDVVLNCDTGTKLCQEKLWSTGCYRYKRLERVMDVISTYSKTRFYTI